MAYAASMVCTGVEFPEAGPPAAAIRPDPSGDGFARTEERDPELQIRARGLGPCEPIPPRPRWLACHPAGIGLEGTLVQTP